MGWTGEDARRSIVCIKMLRSCAPLDPSTLLRAGYECVRRHVILFFLFFYFAARGFGLLDNLVLELLGDGVVVVHLHGEAASALRH